MALIFVSGVAHFFMGVGGSKIHERLAHFFIDIYTDLCDVRKIHVVGAMKDIYSRLSGKKKEPQP